MKVKLVKSKTKSGEIYRLTLNKPMRQILNVDSNNLYVDVDIKEDSLLIKQIKEDKHNEEKR